VKLARLLPLLALAGCLPDPGVLIRDANVEIVITGVEVDDVVDLELDDFGSSVTVQEAGALSLFEQLEPDDYEAELVHRRGAVARCAELDFEVGDEPVVVSVDVDAMTVCDDDDAPRAFEELTETLRRCDGADCEERETRVDDEGRVRLEDETGSFEGDLPAALFDEIVSASLSGDADRLFSGADPDCDPLAEDEESGIELERTVIEVNAGRELERTERVDVELCGGVAQTLRDLLEDAREHATSESVEEPEEP
jgi:hypothetical protein